MTDRKLKTIFLVSRIFSEKADSVILLGFECTINTQNLNKIVGAIFEKMKILNVFLCELPLISRVDRKGKKRAGDICKGTPDTEFGQDWSVGLGRLGAAVRYVTDRKLKTIFSVSWIFP